jgi:hypothetical protein
MTETAGVPFLRHPGDLAGLRSRRRATGEPPAPEPTDIVEVAATAAATEDVTVPVAVPSRGQTETAARTAEMPGSGPTARLVAVVKRIAAMPANLINELRPENLAKVFEPMRADPDNPLLQRSGWVELAVLVPASLAIVALELLIVV